MRFAVVFPALPPALDGIGDHTARLAEGLAAYGDVRVWTAEAAPEPIPGVRVERVFGRAQRRGVYGLLEAVQKDPPDWLILQFEQFSYGRWGLNPYLPRVVDAIGKTNPRTRVALVAHEDFVPISSWKFAVMTTWQRWQFWRLGRAVDAVMCSVEPWAERYRRWFPSARVTHLPVASNIPCVVTTREEERRRLGLAEGTFVLGLFGTVESVRKLSLVRAAMDRLPTQDVCVLYVGPQGARVREALAGLPVRDVGALPGEAVSRHFAAMDVYLAPFSEGVSSRRGSFMVGLQHGLPTVTTWGEETGPLLSRSGGEAFLMASPHDTAAYAREVLRLWEDPAERVRIGEAGRRLYESVFSWDALVERVRRTLASVDGAGRVGGHVADGIASEEEPGGRPPALRETGPLREVST